MSDTSSPSSPTPQKRAALALPRAYSLKELGALELPPAVPRIAPWLDSGESCLLWGGTGCGKSMLAMTLALGVAGGGSALGWRFPNPCKVLFVDGEQSPRDLQKRFAVLGKTIAGHNQQAAAANLLIWGRTLGQAGESFFDLNSDAERARAAVDFLKAEKVGFVVLDNLSTLSDTLADENKAENFKHLQSLLSHLKAANIAAVLVHHSGKNAAKFRGSSNIATTFERILGLVHDDGFPPTALAATATIEKFRGKAPPDFVPAFSFRFTSEEDAAGDNMTAQWIIDEVRGQLAESWRMFKNADWTSIGAFVRAVNDRFSTTFLSKNFQRDFPDRWERRLGIQSKDIIQARKWVGEKKAQDYTDEFAAESAASSPVGTAQF